MKRTLTLIALVLSVVMLFSLTACGAKEEAAPAPAETEEAPADIAVLPVETETEAAEGDGPAANVDPSQLNIGQAIDEVHTGDAWYKDGVEGGDYIYFEAADNSDVGLAYVKVEGGEKAATIVCTVNAAMHLVDAGVAESESTIDIVFEDAFRAYDYKSGTWYVRGNPETLSTIFTGITFACQDDETNTLVLNADGTGTELFQGTEDDLTWVMDSATTVKYNDGSHDHILQIVTDESGALVSLSEQNFRIFVPQA